MRIIAKILPVMLRRYLLIPATIGVLTGVFAILFVFTLDLITGIVLEKIVGYIQPLPAGEGTREFSDKPERFYLLPLTVAVGGFISGILTHFLSPESAGVGTDSAIRAYHRKERLSIKSSLVKLLTSAVTIGTGGTSGREGPIALIGAGVGSTVGNLFRLGEKDRRTALAVGLGAGIAAIFKAPLAGAIISAEVFFKRDFEIEAMIPSFVASVVSYSVFCMVFGFQPIFSSEVLSLSESGYLSLLAYAGLGLFCALVVRLFTLTFFRVKSYFDLLKVHSVLKPAIGGLLAGIVGAVAVPAIGNGYGWIQLILSGERTDLFLIVSGLIGVAIGVSLTLGSGMSGGVFGPSVLIGGFTGALFAKVVNDLTGADLHVPSFTIVGMVSVFAGAAKAPLSTLILIAEMTGGYDLLVPAMISVFISYFLSGEKSIFPSQVPTRIDSPAHIEEWGILSLEKEKVRDHMKVPISVVPETPVEEVLKIISAELIGGVPVVSGTRVIGIVTKSDIMALNPALRKERKAGEIMTPNPIVAVPEDTLADCLRVMIGAGVGRLPIVEDRESMRLVGIITRADIGKAIRRSRF